MTRLKPGRYAVLIFAVFCAVVFFSCGNPAGPISLGWSVLHSINTDLHITHFAISPSGDFYFIVYDPYTRISDIFIFDNGEIIKEFELGYDEYGFSDIGFFGDTVWAVGNKKEGTENLPLLLINDGSGWEENGVNYPGLSGIYNIYPTGPNSAWFLGSHIDSQSEYGVFRYDVSTASYFPRPDPDLVIHEAECDASGTFYIVSYSAKDEQYFLEVTGDSGQSWYTERIELSGETIYSIDGSAYLESPADALYFVSYVKCNDTGYSAVVRRTGSPGDGWYEMVFGSPLGPHFRGISAMAFKDDDEAICVGYYTTAVYKNDDWLLEENVPEHYFREGFYLDANSDGYYVLTENEGYYNILYHE